MTLNEFVPMLVPSHDVFEDIQRTVLAGSRRVLYLREVQDLQGRIDARNKLGRKCSEQRRFAGSVAPDQRISRTILEAKVRVCEELVVADSDGYAVQVDLA